MKVLDVFAGAGGWDVATHRLGWNVDRCEIMPEANATAEAAGLGQLVHEDVCTLHIRPGDYRMVIGSPSCKRFSVAGIGTGRKAQDVIIEIVMSYATERPIGMQQAAEMIGDEDAALVLEPMRLICEGRPSFIALEQVPSVLPIWDAYAIVLRERGWQTVTGVLNAEQYGVPQTRRRAFLLASLEPATIVRLPDPTHSRYYGRDPQRMDAGVKPWVSMAEALGWGMTGWPSMTVTGGGTDGGDAEPFGNRARAGMEREHEAGRWHMRAAGVTGEGRPRDPEYPSPTLTGKGTAYWEMRSNYTKGGDLTGRGTRSVDHPSLTVTSNIGKNAWQPTEGEGRWQHRDEREAWPLNRPATTVMGDLRIDAPGHRDRSFDGERHHKRSIRVTVEEAAALQTFPADYPWQGKQGKKFLQVGNAVPPMLAEAVLRQFTS